MYICQQQFKTENRAYINLHFAVLFVTKKRDMLTCTLHPRHTLHGHYYDLKVLSGVSRPLLGRKLVSTVTLQIREAALQQ